MGCVASCLHHGSALWGCLESLTVPVHGRSSSCRVDVEAFLDPLTPQTLNRKRYTLTPELEPPKTLHRIWPCGGRPKGLAGPKPETQYKP